MKRQSGLASFPVAPLATVGFVVLLVVAGAGSVYAKRRPDAPALNTATSHLFQLIDSGYNGKLDDFYVLADTYKDPKSPAQEYIHILRVSYDKARAFGKLAIYVRSVGKLDPQQLQTYTAKQIYEFGETDMEKFVKSSDADFGSAGDLYLKASDSGVLASASVTDEARREYDALIAQYLVPALEKNSANARPGGR